MRPRIYDDRFARQYGYWRLVISDVVEKYLACGILKHGFARVPEAMEFIVEGPVEGTPWKTLTLFVPRGPQTGQVAVTWMDAVGDRAALKVDEIAYSLYFE